MLLGTWQPRDKIDTPTFVPATTRDHLHTPTGLLYNEIIMSPTVILSAVYTMLDKVVDMDTGTYV